jgi:hypothetical protein
MKTTITTAHKTRKNPVSEAPALPDGVDQTEVDKYLNTVPVRLRQLARRALGKRTNSRRVMALKCYECCNFEDHYVRVKECRAWRCPLWAYRPT